MNHIVTLPDGAQVPALGQGTWYLGESRAAHEREKEALLAGVGAGMTLIDTAEMYGDGKAERLIGETIKGLDREKLFIVSKVYPHHAGRKNIFQACENTLSRLGTDYLDLYLLHWRGSIPLRETVSCMEELVKMGRIRRWGVSNFDTEDMEELWSVPSGKKCAVNQVLYHVASRGIEYDLLPWMREHHVPLMAYCPMAQAGDLKRGILEDPVLKKIAAAHSVEVPQVMIAWAMRDGSTIAIPRTGSPAHAKANATADSFDLTKEELAAIDRAYPAPVRKTWLDMV